MFRLHDDFEYPTPAPLRAIDPNARRYAVAQVLFDLPLWVIRVVENKEEESLEHRFLATDEMEVLALLSRGWASATVHVLLPAYMTGTGEQRLVKCSAIWDCRVHGDVTRFVSSFEAEGEFYVDPMAGVDGKQLERVAIRWKSTSH